MISLISFIGSLTVLMLSVKTYQDLQAQIAEVSKLRKQLDFDVKESKTFDRNEETDIELV